MKKIILLMGILSTIFLSAKDVSLDNKSLTLNIKNNTTNALNLPFYPKNAKLATSYPDKFVIELQGKTILVTPKIEDLEVETANLYFWDLNDNSYLIKVNGKGTEEFFNMTLKVDKPKNKRLIRKFETGSIKKDVKNLIKKVILTNKIAGYQKRTIEGEKILTNDLFLQKVVVHDGNKYRVESWLVGNRTNNNLVLSEENFYTEGILAVALETNKLPPQSVIKMWLIVNKSSLKD